MSDSKFLDEKVVQNAVIISEDERERLTRIPPHSTPSYSQVRINSLDNWYFHTRITIHVLTVHLFALFSNVTKVAP